MERWERLRVSDAARTRHARPSCRARLCSMPSIACKKPTRTSTQHRSHRGTLQACSAAGCLSEGGWGLHSPVHSLSRPARARPLRATTCPRAQLPSGRGGKHKAQWPASGERGVQCEAVLWAAPHDPSPPSPTIHPRRKAPVGGGTPTPRPACLVEEGGRTTWLVSRSIIPICLIVHGQEKLRFSRSEAIRGCGF